MSYNSRDYVRFQSVRKRDLMLCRAKAPDAPKSGKLRTEKMSPGLMNWDLVQSEFGINSVTLWNQPALCQQSRLLEAVL